MNDFGWNLSGDILLTINHSNVCYFLSSRKFLLVAIHPNQCRSEILIGFKCVASFSHVYAKVQRKHLSRAYV